MSVWRRMAGVRRDSGWLREQLLRDASGVVADAMQQSYDDGYARGVDAGWERAANSSKMWRDGYNWGVAAARADTASARQSELQVDLAKAALASGNPVAVGDVLARLQQQDGLRGQRQHDPEQDDPDQEQDRGF